MSSYGYSRRTTTGGGVSYNDKHRPNYHRNVNTLTRLGGGSSSNPVGRNVPRPIQTCSLKKENGGQDITAVLVNRNNGSGKRIGWGSALPPSNSDEKPLETEHRPKEQNQYPPLPTDGKNVPWAMHPPNRGMSSSPPNQEKGERSYPERYYPPYREYARYRPHPYDGYRNEERYHERYYRHNDRAHRYRREKDFDARNHAPNSYYESKDLRWGDEDDDSFKNDSQEQHVNHSYEYDRYVYAPRRHPQEVREKMDQYRPRYDMHPRGGYPYRRSYEPQRYEYEERRPQDPHYHRPNEEEVVMQAIRERDAAEERKKDETPEPSAPIVILRNKQTSGEASSDVANSEHSRNDNDKVKAESNVETTNEMHDTESVTHDIPSSPKSNEACKTDIEPSAEKDEIRDETGHETNDVESDIADKQDRKVLEQQNVLRRVAANKESTKKKPIKKKEDTSEESKDDTLQKWGPRTKGVLFRRQPDGTLVNADLSEEDLAKREERRKAKIERELAKEEKRKERLKQKEKTKKLPKENDEKSEDKNKFVPAPPPAVSAWLQGPPRSVIEASMSVPSEVPLKSSNDIDIEDITSESETETKKDALKTWKKDDTMDFNPIGLPLNTWNSFGGAPNLFAPPQENGSANATSSWALTPTKPITWTEPNNEDDAAALTDASAAVPRDLLSSGPASEEEAPKEKKEFKRRPYKPRPKHPKPRKNYKPYRPRENDNDKPYRTRENDNDPESVKKPIRSNFKRRYQKDNRRPNPPDKTDEKDSRPVRPYRNHRPRYPRKPKPCQPETSQ